MNDEQKRQLAELVKDTSIQQVLLELVDICSDTSFKCAETGKMDQSAETWKKYQHSIHDAYLKIETDIAFLPTGDLNWP